MQNRASPKRPASYFPGPVTVSPEVPKGLKVTDEIKGANQGPETGR